MFWHRYFSYEHFYVIYCKFWELDTDHDFLIDKENLIRYGNHSLTYRIVDRIFTQVSLFPWCIQNLAIVYENVMLCVIILAIVLWLRYQGNSQAWQKERWVMKTSFTSYYQRKTNHLSLALNTGNCFLNRRLVCAFGELFLLSSNLQFIFLTCGGGARTPFPSAGMPNIFHIFMYMPYWIFIIDVYLMDPHWIFIILTDVVKHQWCFPF